MKQRIILVLLIAFASFTSCKDDDEVLLAPIISGIENAYTVIEDAKLELNPMIENGETATISWSINGNEVAQTRIYVFQQSEPGEYKLLLKAGNEGGIAKQEITISVIEKGLPPVITNLEEEYNIETSSELTINPTITSENECTYAWFLGDEEVATTLEYTFNSNKPGKYKVTFKATNEWGTSEKTLSIVVTQKVLTIEGVEHTLLPLELPDYLKDKDDIKWEVIEETPSTLYRLSQMDSKKAMFIAAEKGEYILQVTSGEIKVIVKVVVAKAAKEPSPYIAQVFDYFPAPGQFVNKLPQYEEGDTHEDMVAKAGESLIGEDANMITLGGWGGYVVLGFDHTIVNVAGKKDFRIEGNAFGANANPDVDAPFGGSCEPGIIMVSYDANGNGEPDDEWYEIVGSGNFTAENENWYQKAIDNGNDVNTYRDFQMTYHKPTVEDPANIADYIYWTNNKGEEGYKFKHSYHRQSYYPLWINDDTITFDGIRLAENGIDESGQGNYYVLYAFKHGYVDNFPNNDDKSAIDIDWAIDKDGNKVNLPGIDFVKVYNGVDQENGWLGEASTEVARGSNLHLLKTSIDSIQD